MQQLFLNNPSSILGEKKKQPFYTYLEANPKYRSSTTNNIGMGPTLAFTARICWSPTMSGAAMYLFLIFQKERAVNIPPPSHALSTMGPLLKTRRHMNAKNNTIQTSLTFTVPQILHQESLHSQKNASVTIP